MVVATSSPENCCPSFPVRTGVILLPGLRVFNGSFFSFACTPVWRNEDSKKKTKVEEGSRWSDDRSRNLVVANIAL